MNDAAETIVIVVMLVVVVTLIFVGPVFTIWSLNTVFGFEIPLTFKTWCGVCWLHMLLHGIRANFKRQTTNNQ